MDRINATHLKLIKKPETVGLEASAYLANLEQNYRIDKIGVHDLKGRICIDVGAHLGIVSMVLAKMGGIVHAYEPHPINYQNTLKHIKINDLTTKILPFNEAIWDNSGIEPLRIDDEYPRSSDSHTMFEPESERRIYVKTITPELLFRRTKEKKIGYLKLNCEGAEYQILKYLVKNPSILERIEKIMVEVHPTYMKKNHLKEIVIMLENMREQIEWLYVILPNDSWWKGVPPEIKERLKINTTERFPTTDWRGGLN